MNICIWNCFEMIYIFVMLYKYLDEITNENEVKWKEFDFKIFRIINKWNELKE